MDKRSYFLNNPSSENIRIVELGIMIPPGISNLFELNPELNYEQIDYSLRYGTLHAAMENGLCYIVPDTTQQSFSNDILIRKPFQVQILPSRARFTVVKNVDNNIFTTEDDIDLFKDSNDDVKPARQIEEEIKNKPDDFQTIEATIKEANLHEKPIENRYGPAPVLNIENQQKIKNDITMGYETCYGKNANGKRCMRRAKVGKKYCGLHKSQKSSSANS